MVKPLCKVRPSVQPHPTWNPNHLVLLSGHTVLVWQPQSPPTILLQSPAVVKYQLRGDQSVVKFFTTNNIKSTLAPLKIANIHTYIARAETSWRSESSNKYLVVIDKLLDYS